MDSKVKGCEINLPFNSLSVTYFKFDDSLTLSSVLVNILSEKYVNYIENYFNGFFEKLISSTKNKKTIILLNKLRRYFEITFAESVLYRISTDKMFGIYKGLENGEELIKDTLLKYMFDYFFFAGITFNILNDDIEELQELLKHLKRDRKELLIRKENRKKASQLKNGDVSLENYNKVIFYNQNGNSIYESCKKVAKEVGLEFYNFKKAFEKWVKTNSIPTIKHYPLGNKLKS